MQLLYAYYAYLFLFKQHNTDNHLIKFHHEKGNAWNFEEH